MRIGLYVRWRCATVMTYEFIDDCKDPNFRHIFDCRQCNVVHSEQWWSSHVWLLDDLGLPGSSKSWSQQNQIGKVCFSVWFQGFQPRSGDVTIFSVWLSNGREQRFFGRSDLFWDAPKTGPVWGNGWSLEGILVSVRPSTPWICCLLCGESTRWSLCVRPTICSRRIAGRQRMRKA